MSQRSPSLARRAVAACLKLGGMACFRLRRYRAARRRFERALALIGDDFDCYVWLGRIAYRLGDYAGWRRECGHARRTSPTRFARLKHPFELFEAHPPQPGGDDGQLAPWRSIRMSYAGSPPGRSLPATSWSTPDASSAPDDFTSPAERARFRDLPPIAEEELVQVDLDELGRRLSS